MLSVVEVKNGIVLFCTVGRVKKGYAMCRNCWVEL